MKTRIVHCFKKVGTKVEHEVLTYNVMMIKKRDPKLLLTDVKDEPKVEFPL